MTRRRRLGPYGPAVRPVVLGTFGIGGWWWGGADEQQAIRALQTAFDHGIDAVDTAPVYGFGRAEQIVGKAIEGRDVAVCTKFGMAWDTGRGTTYFDTRDVDGTPHTIEKWATPERIAAECEASLRRLGVERIDLYQLHWPDPDVPPEEVMGACERLVEQGKIASVGVCNAKVGWLERALASGPLTAVQPKWSWLFPRRGDDVIPWAHGNGLGCLTYSALEQGLLTGQLDPHADRDPGDGRFERRAFAPDAIERVNATLAGLEGLAADHDASIAQLVLAATLRVPGITAAIVGARTPEHARANAEAMRIELSEPELDRVRDTFAAHRAAEAARRG